MHLCSVAKIGLVTRLLIILVTLIGLSACGGGSGGNSAPVFAQSSYQFSLDEDTIYQGQLTATDADNDALTYSVLTTASQGVFNLNASTGAFSYSPNADYHGADTVVVQVSDGQATARTTLNFTIVSVNDAPVYVSHSLQSGEQGQILGQIEAYDVDGDSLTFRAANTPELGTLELFNDGTFIYTPYQLELIDDKFTVLISDGALEIAAEISLLSQYSTNLDKLTYYYASAYSHLKQAEQQIALLTDDVMIQSAWQNVIIGYYQAGFTERAEALLAEHIYEVSAQAAAYKALAEKAAPFASDVAVTFYSKAFERYNQLVAEKGFSNISATDASFYQSVSKALLSLGNAEFSRTVSNQLITIADAVNAPLYSTAYGRILVAYGNYAASEVTNWLNDKTETQYQVALQAVNDLGYLANNAGYQILSGYSVTNLKTLYKVTTARLYFSLGHFEESKDFTANAFADYNYFADDTPTYRSLDPAYDYPQGQYAANTLARYPAGMRGLAAMVAANFGNKYEYVMQLLVQYGSEAQQTTATEDVQLYLAFNRITAGDEVAVVLDDLKSYFVDRYDSLHQVLVDYTGNNLADLLTGAGLTDAAKATALLGLEIFSTERYVQNIFSGTSANVLYLLGNRGCLSMVSTMDKYVGNRDGLTEVCDNHLTRFVPGATTTLETIDAYRTALLLKQLLADNSANTAYATVLTEQGQLISDTVSQIRHNLESAAYLVKVGELGRGKQLMENALATARKYVVNAEYADSVELRSLLTILNAYLVNDNSVTIADSQYGLRNYISGVRAQAGKQAIDQILPASLTVIGAAVADINTALDTLVTNTQQNIASQRFKLLAGAGLHEQVQRLIDDDVTGPADELALRAMFSVHLALRNDFPELSVANVDTDNDGRPNFFLHTATEAQILASGLEADDDADGDGVPDTDDKAPLDPTRH